MKIILKILLSLSLLGVVVAVSYLKTTPGEKSGSGANPEIAPEFNSVSIDSVEGKDAPPTESRPVKVSSATEASSSKGVADKAVKKSVGTIMTSAEKPKILSVSSQPSNAIADTAELVAVDSSKTKKKESATKEKTADSDAKIREEQIILYFKQKLNSLPDDLSSYEKKVAIKEVRDETCDLFHISRVKLNQLARVYKITYP